MVEQVIGTFGRLSILLNNVPSPTCRPGAEAFIDISSIAGVTGVRNRAAYSDSKAVSLD
jgi:hypothetical protein